MPGPLPPDNHRSGKPVTAQTFNRMTPYLFLAPAAITMAIALLYPLGYMVYGSFRDWDPSQNISETDFVGLKNYVTLFFDPAFRESLSVTLIFAFTVVVAEMVIGVGLALLLDRNIRGISVLRTLFILPMMIAPVVVGLMWRYMYHPTVGTFNKTLKSLGFDGVDWLGQHALLSVIIADIWQWTPFILILALAALQSLPASALEAARIDGATAWQQIWHIKLPLMMPVLIVTALLAPDRRVQGAGSDPGDDRRRPRPFDRDRGAADFTHRHRVPRTGHVAAAMSNYLLILLLLLTLAMFAIHPDGRMRARRALPARCRRKADGSYERQNPAFYALLAVLIFMSVGPVLLMLVNSFKLDVDIIWRHNGLDLPADDPELRDRAVRHPLVRAGSPRFLLPQVRRRVDQLA